MDLEREMLAEDAGKWWWVFLATGIIWLLIGIVVLRLNMTSVATVGYLIGAMFVLGALSELMIASAKNDFCGFTKLQIAPKMKIAAMT